MNKKTRKRQQAKTAPAHLMGKLVVVNGRQYLMAGGPGQPVRPLARKTLATAIEGNLNAKI